MLILVCSKTDSELGNLLIPGGIDLSPLSHSDQGTRLRRLKRFLTEGHLFDVRYISFLNKLMIALYLHSLRSSWAI